MTLKKWMKCVDPIIDVVIWTDDDDDETPSFSGHMLDIPWWYLDCKIGCPDEDADSPIYISKHENKYGYTEPCVVIHLLV